MLKMQKLVEQLNKYAHQYYVLDNPTISDKEYDKLYDELVVLEQDNKFVYPDSPTRRVGGAIISSFSPYKHKLKLYSLDKVKTIADVELYLDKISKSLGATPKISVEHKFDGLTLSLTYVDGNLITGATRGDGTTGEDVTEQIKTIKSIPMSIPFKGYIEIQGEGIMRLSRLAQFNAKSSETLKNARNAVAGAIRNLNPKVTASRNLDFIAYNIGYHQDITFSSQEEVNAFLKSNNFRTDSAFSIVDNLQDIEDKLKMIEENRANQDFLIDGAVLKINNFSYRDELGFTEKAPRWALAYKFLAEETTTILNDVLWQVSRTSKLNPLALLEPVDLMGVTVSKATLNNYLDIQKKDIKINSRVIIRRSNDVIPEIMGVSEHYSDSIDIKIPEVCPACGSQVRQEGAFIFCTNTIDCAPQKISAIDHFCSKPCMNIDGVSEKTVEQLYTEVGIDSIDKLFTIKEEQLVNLEGFKDKKINNLINNIKKAKDTTLARFVFALGIPTIGKKTAQVLTERFRTLDAIKSAKKEELAVLPDFGDIMASNIVNYFENQSNITIIDNMINYGVNFKEQEEQNGIFTGKLVVLTGSLNVFKRSEAQALILSRGGQIADTVNKSVNLVIVGQDAGSKLEKANKLGITIITEEEFVAMLEL